MSSFNIKSQVIARRDSSGPISDAINAKGSLAEVYGCDNLPQTADVGSWVKCISVPSSARLSSLSYSAAAAITTTSLDIGVWFPTSIPSMSGVQAQSAVVAARLISSSAFGTALTVPGVGGAVDTDAMGTLAANSVQNRYAPLWQQLGLASDPMLDLDIGFSVRTTNTAAGYVGLRARYVR